MRPCIDGRSTQVDRRLVPILLVALPLLAFLAFLNPATLEVGNAGWLIRGTDNGENALGAHAYWHDTAAGASLKTTLLNAPEGVPVLYTDSNPLVTLAVKPFAALLPSDAQVVGPILLLTLILQVIFAWLLLRRYAPGPMALWAGVALLAFPPTLANRLVHVNLMAHWTILAALYLFLDAERSARMKWWLPLIAITALIHSYLLVMVGAIWASAMLMQILAGPGRTRAMAALHIAIVLASVAGLAWWLGVGDQASTGSFGAFSMPLDALWNPGAPGISSLLPAYERSAGRGFEGFHYLGAGGMLLVVVALAVARLCSPRDSERAAANRLRSLAPALVVLATLAVARLPLPAVLLAALDPIRASGRLFWPVGYAMVFMAVLAVFRLSARNAGLALTAMVALQIIDLAGMASASREQSREAGARRLYVRTLDPRWDQLVGRAASIAFVPADVTHDLGLFQEVAWRAVKTGTPVTNVYAARTSRAAARRVDNEQAAFLRGDLRADRLYVLLDDAAPPPAATTRLMKIDGVTIVAPMTAR